MLRALDLLYFMAPAYVANMSAPLARYWKGWNRPISARRRLGIPPGQPWLPFDQIDFVLGALILVAPRSILGPGDAALLLALSFGGHIVVNHAAYWLGIRDVRW